jgi:hypothetical protein
VSAAFIGYGHHRRHRSRSSRHDRALPTAS